MFTFLCAGKSCEFLHSPECNVHILDVRSGDVEANIYQIVLQTAGGIIIHVLWCVVDT